jgi:phage-related protein
MTVLTTSWSYAGTNLNSSGAYNIRMLGIPESVPGRRGGNLVIPGKSGRVYREKRHDERIISLAMYVKGDSGTALQTNVETLMELFAKDGQNTLSRTMADASVQNISAEVVNVISFEPLSDKLYSMVIEFLAADPYWKDNTNTSVDEDDIASSPYNFSCNNSGTYANDRSVITIDGIVTNPRITIDSVYVQYTGTVGSGDQLVIDCEDFTAELNGTAVAGDISHSGAVSWLVIPAGNNTATFTGSSLTTPDVLIEFTPLYI